MRDSIGGNQVRIPVLLPHLGVNASGARDFADAMPELIRIAEGGGQSAPAYLLAVARDEAQRAMRLSKVEVAPEAG